MTNRPTPEDLKKRLAEQKAAEAAHMQQRIEALEAHYVQGCKDARAHPDPSGWIDRAYKAIESQLDQDIIQVRIGMQTASAGFRDEMYRMVRQVLIDDGYTVEPLPDRGISSMVVRRTW